MSGGLVRARLSAFLCGFALAGGFAVYQLRKDVWDSHKMLAEQAVGVEKRLKRLEDTLPKGETATKGNGE